MGEDPTTAPAHEPAEEETAAYHGDTETDHGSTAQLRDGATEATDQPTNAAGGEEPPNMQGGAALTAAQMEEMMTASLQQAVNAVGEMNTSARSARPGDLTFGTIPRNMTGKGGTPAGAPSQASGTDDSQNTGARTTQVQSQEAMTIPDADDPVAFGNMTVDHEGNSPQKRGRSAGDHSSGVAGTTLAPTLTVEASAQALRGELREGFAQQQSRLSREIKEEIGEAITKVNRRIEDVERGVTKQLNKALSSMQELSARQDKQGVAIVQVGAETKQLANKILHLEEKLAKLEGRGRLERHDAGEPRRPAFIVGGWSPDQEAATTLEKAKTVLRDLQVDVDMEGAFVPGLRRGYVIVPMTTRADEDTYTMRDRVQKAVVRVRNANVTLGDAVPALDGSVPTARAEGSHQALDVEFATGSVWYDNRKISSTGGPKPEGATDAGPGWVDLGQIARLLGVTGDTIADAWRPLAVQQRGEPRQGPDPKLPPAPHGIGAFMDDTYIWGSCHSWIQKCLDATQARLRQRGLEINPKKTMVMCSRSAAEGCVIGDRTVPADPPESIMPVLGSPLTFINQPGALVCEMQHRARRGYHANKKILTCKEARLDDRLRSSITLIRSAALWACETWPISDYILKAANSIQYHYIREIIGRKRGPHEEWLSWHQRTLREARMEVYRNKCCGGRWSSFILRVRWQLLGHVARHPSPTRDILEWRNQRWWNAQQRLHPTVGARHPHQFNSQLDDERKVIKTAGTDWMQQAQDREHWQRLLDTFLEQQDVEWATGKQAKLQNIRQAKPSAAKRKARAPRGQFPSAALLAITGGMCP
ncbi:unnamed protein product [Symbiodinium sp. CCMP2592]|nr:unnamed protein product [Symbiodinium sp. CCMP2592]